MNDTIKQIKDLTSIVKVYDNQGQTNDRYTMLIVPKDSEDGFILGMNTIPFSPCGICQFCGDITKKQILKDNFTHLGKEIKMKNLNDDCLQSILYYVKEG